VRIPQIMTGLAMLAALQFPLTKAYSQVNLLEYPSKQVHLVVGYGAGGGVDLMARAFAKFLSEDLSQTFVVDNKPGAAGNISAEYVARSQDPYKLLFAGGAHVINASLYEKIPYEPIKDFTPISLLAVAPNVIVSTPSLNVKNLKDLVALAKISPGRITYASPGTGSPMHLAMELFSSMAGIKLVNVPYNGGAPSLVAALAGQTDLLTVSLPTVIAQLKSGKLIALGVTGKSRSPLLPDVPTVEEAAGLPGYEALAWYGLLGPQVMPLGAAEKLNSAIQRKLLQPDVKLKLLDQGFEPANTTSAEFRKFLIADMEKWAKVVKSSGATAH